MVCRDVGTEVLLVTVLVVTLDVVEYLLVAGTEVVVTLLVVPTEDVVRPVVAAEELNTVELPTEVVFIVEVALELATFVEVATEVVVGFELVGTAVLEIFVVDISELVAFVTVAEVLLVVTFVVLAGTVVVEDTELVTVGVGTDVLSVDIVDLVDVVGADVVDDFAVVVVLTVDNEGVTVLPTVVDEIELVEPLLPDVVETEVDIEEVTVGLVLGLPVETEEDFVLVIMPVVEPVLMEVVNFVGWLDDRAVVVERSVETVVDLLGTLEVEDDWTDVVSFEVVVGTELELVAIDVVNIEAVDSFDDRVEVEDLVLVVNSVLIVLDLGVVATDVEED